MATRTAPTVADPREAKLPVWAQDTINDLRRELAHAHGIAECARLNTKPEGSDTLLIPGLRGEAIGLGASPRVEYQVGPDHRRQTVQVRTTDAGTLLVMAERQIAVYPRATNTIEIVSIR